MRDSHIRYVLILISSTILLVLLTGSINYEKPEYSNADLNKYIKMAEASPGITSDVIKPFVYRIGAPWVVGNLPFSIPINFLLLNSVALILLILSFYYFLIEFGVKKYLALVISLMFLLNKYFFVFLTWNHFQLSDTLSLAMLFFSFILIKRHNLLGLFLTMSIGMLVKEYLLMIIPFGLTYYFLKKLKKELLYFSGISLVSVSIFFLVRLLINSEGGESLFTQYTTQLVYYSKPELLIKRFIIPFTPFGLLPFVFYKDLVKFSKLNFPFLIYVISVISLSFFGEPERLIEPIAPIYYLFITILIDKYIIQSKSKLNSMWIFGVLLTTCLISSFYHLWGIVILPNESFSIVLTVILTLLVTSIFMKFKLNRFN